MEEKGERARMVFPLYLLLLLIFPYYFSSLFITPVFGVKCFMWEAVSFRVNRKWLCKFEEPSPVSKFYFISHNQSWICGSHERKTRMLDSRVQMVPLIVVVSLYEFWGRFSKGGRSGYFWVSPGNTTACMVLVRNRKLSWQIQATLCSEQFFVFSYWPLFCSLFYCLSLGVLNFFVWEFWSHAGSSKFKHTNAKPLMH